MSIQLDNVSKFKWISHKIIPLVYNESLSYYEFLCKVLCKLNEVINNFNEYNDLLISMDETMHEWMIESDVKYAKFVTKIENLFNDYVTETNEIINAKLDEVDETILQKLNEIDEAITEKLADIDVQITGEIERINTEVYSAIATMDTVVTNAVNDMEDDITNAISDMNTETTTAIQTLTNDVNTAKQSMINDVNTAIDNMENIVVQGEGNNTDKVISQKGVTDIANGIREQISEASKTPIYVEINNEVLKVVTKYGNSKDLCITFGKRGCNNIPDFISFGIIDNSGAYPLGTANETIFLTPNISYHAPFIIKAVNNINGDMPNSNDYTGGDYNYNGTQGEGYSATAICDALRYFVDGYERTSYAGYANNITIKWSNRVQATNTKKSNGTGRYVIRENQIMTFDVIKNWESTFEILVYEPLTFEKYCGFQSVSGTTYSNIRYIGGANRYLYTYNQTSNSGDNAVNAIKAYGTKDQIEIELDTGYDTGNRRFYSGVNGAFNENNKLAFTVMESVSAPNGSMYCGRAVYKFTGSY